jgi:hypothetical protein
MNPYLPPGNAGNWDAQGGGQGKDSLMQQNMELIRSKLYSNGAQERPRSSLSLTWVDCQTIRMLTCWVCGANLSLERK